MDLRQEFVLLAQDGGLSFRALCQRYGISRKTGYKWLQRFVAEGAAGLADRSRRPHHQPRRIPLEMEQAVLAYRQRFRYWGGRKLQRLMQNDGYRDVPSPSTITEVLRRNHQLHNDDRPPQPNYLRFEHPYPNDLWQMDFMGAFPLARGLCHTLTVLDDHSRFSVCLTACRDERQATVQRCLISTFERYGLPLRMCMDNGSPWGCGAERRLTQLGAWLIEQGIGISHSRPYHPQTQGKDERFHRTLQAELVGRRTFADHVVCQHAFDPWRQRYNTQRPHESLNQDTPVEHYQPSPRPYRHNPPPYEYAPGDEVRKVQANLHAGFKYRYVFIGQALKGKYVAFRPTTEDGVYTIHFCQQHIGVVDLKHIPKRQPRTTKAVNS